MPSLPAARSRSSSSSSSSSAAASSLPEMPAASSEVITPFQPKLIRINGMPHLITTVDSTLPLEMHTIHQTPSSIPHQTTPYWRGSTHSQASVPSSLPIASTPSFGNNIYVFNKYFQERKSTCTVAFHPAVSSTRFRQNIASPPHPVPSIRVESSGFLQLDIKPFHVKQFPETELLSIELLLALLTSFDQQPQRVNIPLMKRSSTVLQSVLIEKESTITIRLLETEMNSKFNEKSHKQDQSTRSTPTESSTTSSPFESSEASETDTVETMEGESEVDSETELEGTMNIDEGLIRPVIEETTTTISSQSLESSSSSSSSSSMMSQGSVSLGYPFPMRPTPFPIGASAPMRIPPPQMAVVSMPPGLGNRVPMGSPSGMLPYASAFFPFPRRIFPHFPDDITNTSSLWNHIRNLVEFVLQEVNSNLQLFFIELLQRVLPKENHSWISSLAALYQKRLTWFERNQLLCFSEEMMGLSNGLLAERIFFQISSIICLSRISEASCERNVSRARAVFDRHKDRTLPTVANGLLLMSYHSLYKKLKAEKYSL